MSGILEEPICRAGKRNRIRFFVSDFPVSTVILARAGDEAANRSLADRLLFCAIGLAAGLNGSAAAGRPPKGSSPYTPEGLSELLIEGLRQYNPRTGRLDKTLREYLSWRSSHIPQVLPRNSSGFGTSGIVTCPRRMPPSMICRHGARPCAAAMRTSTLD